MSRGKIGFPSTSGWWEDKKWVFSFEAEAEVLELKGLRKEISEELKIAMKRYCGS